MGLDLDLEALEWCKENNVNKLAGDSYSRIFLFHGNVLQPLEAKLVRCNPEELLKNITLKENDNSSVTSTLDSVRQDGSAASSDNNCTMKTYPLQARDIVCAFNYSCCCLHQRADLVLYFKHALGALSKKGGIFVMDLYGGTSSEQKLRLQRRFANFMV